MGRVREETINGAKWQMLQKCTLQPVQLLYGMILARLISPEEMGVLALISVFLVLAATLASGGFGQALIRKLDRTEMDINTMFWFNAAMSFLLCVVLCLAAPLIAEFFHQPALVWLTRVSAIMMFLNSLASVHWTLYSCWRNFKTPAIIHICSTIVGIPVCLYLAFIGWSYWSIVVQGVVSGLVALVAVWIATPWKPRFLFSWASFRELFGFGGRMTLAALLFQASNQLRSLIIGKFYAPADLGLYNRGDHLGNVLPATIVNMLDTVTYPILATIQNEDERLKEVFRLYVRITSLVIIWAVMFLASMATPLVLVMYGKTWVGCIPLLQILCLQYATWHVTIIGMNLIKVKGRADVYLRLDVTRHVVSVALMLAGAAISIEAICWASVVFIQLSIWINSWYTNKLLKLSWWEQVKDYGTYMLLAAASCLPAYIMVCFIAPQSWDAVEGSWTGNLAYYSYLLGIIGVGALVSSTLYFGVLQKHRDRALIEIAKSLEQKAAIVKIPLLGRWLHKISLLQPSN